ncbi:MAG: DUF748 domain-containing protein [Betaproteobacteria bacterium]|nr:DUF748 domain-containing protein [Betaproteobacteria bacterium]
MTLLARILRKRARLEAAAAQPAPRRRKWLKRTLLGIAITLGLLVAFGFLVAPPLVKSLLVGKASEELGRKVTVGEIRINPLLLTVEVENFAIHEPGSEQQFVAFKRLRIDLEGESIYRRAPVLREVLLEAPYVHVVRMPGNRFNFTDLLEKFAKDDKKDEEPARFSVNNIRLTGGSIDVDDQPGGTKHQVRELTIAVPFISNLPYHGDTFVQPAFSARINGTAFDLKGKSKPFHSTRDTTLTVRLNDLDIPYYLKYVPFQLPYRLDSARLDVDATLTFSQSAAAKPKLVIAGMTALRDVKLASPESQPLVGFKRLEVRTDGIEAFGDRVPLKSVKLEGLDVHATRLSDGSINLAVLGQTGKDSAATGNPPEAEPAAEAKPPASGKARTVTVESVAVDASVAFRDESVQPGFATTLAPITVSVQGLSTAADAAPANIRLSASTDASEQIEVEGTYGVASSALELDASLAKLAPRRYAPYYASRILFDIVDGALDLRAHLNAGLSEQPPRIVVSRAGLDLRDLKLRKRGQPQDFLALASLSVADAGADTVQRKASVGEIRLMKPIVRASRAKNGAIDLTQLVPGPGEPRPATAPAAATTASSAPADAPWSVTLGKFLLEQGTVQFTDDVPPSRVVLELSPVRMEVRDVAFGAPATSHVDFRTRINRTAELGVSGTFGLAPVQASLKTRLTALDLLPFEPYFADKLNVTLNSAAASFEGALTVSLPDKGAPVVGYEGNFGLAKLALVDKASAESLLKWNSLFVEGIKARTEPFSLAVRNVALTDFQSQLQILPDGTINVQNLVAKDPAKDQAAGNTPPAASKAPPPADAPAGSPVPKSIRVDQVTLQGGTVHFSDRMIKPNVNATLTEVGGRVSGLLSDAGSRADVDLRGKLGNSAALEITGQINPLAGDLFADLKVSFRDIELPPFTPYSGKYAGYTIEKGKLSLNLSYFIEKRSIKAENKVFIDQFTFGEKVESADAVNLPVTLAVSLLKDRNGQINLDVPVSGSLDDPKFRLGRVIWQVIVNLITKAITSPFALLGSLMGGDGEQLSYLEFPVGAAAFESAGQGKLDQLSKALTERPALKLEITGHVDPEKDHEGLLRAAFERKLKTQRFNELVRAGEAPAGVEAVTVAPDQYERVLTKAYKTEKFPKPRNAIGLEKSLPKEEMEKLMLTHIVIGEDDLRHLAMQRAQAVKDALTTKGQIAPERIFLLEPKSLSAEAKQNVSGSRTDFVIR